LKKNDDYSKHAKITEDEVNGSFAAPNKTFTKTLNGWGKKILSLGNSQFSMRYCVEGSQQ